ncbi:unnamed protein product [Toxocara canis]|uniref:Transmembrane protein n=1 Tax=Toxocara canis TaxID=6265 RepID=A0A183V6N6_TOXCA|nr:unnamed protein product [Toxocara canis]
MVGKAMQEVSRRHHLFGLFLLFVVNVCWVVAAEISRPKGYDNLANSNEVDSMEMELLTPAEFEQLTVSEESDGERTSDVARKVRFAQMREVRHMPVSLADEALRARLPYATTNLLCTCSLPSQLKYSIVLSPLWIICTLSYQASLLFLSVSSVNLISASSSLLVLLFSAICAFSPSDRFTLTKLSLVACNLVGVAIVSEYSVSLFGTSLALFSALCYALYLVYFSYCQSSGFNVDMNFMFG